MKIDFNELEMAFDFVSSMPRFTSTAILSKTSGQIYYQSDYTDSDELPEDIDTSDDYIAIPHKKDLFLGRKLVRRFVSEYMPDDFDHVEHMFSRKGAYGRFKDYLARLNMLETWHRYEEKKCAEALKQWCELHKIEYE